MFYFLFIFIFSTVRQYSTAGLNHSATPNYRIYLNKTAIKGYSKDLHRPYFFSASKQTPAGVAIPEREHNAADADVAPELPAPTLVRDPIITRSKKGTKIACPVRYREDNSPCVCVWGGGGE